MLSQYSARQDKYPGPSAKSARTLPRAAFPNTDAGHLSDQSFSQ
jgi:hypothetical protein